MCIYKCVCVYICIYSIAPVISQVVCDEKLVEQVELIKEIRSSDLLREIEFL